MPLLKKADCLQGKRTERRERAKEANLDSQAQLALKRGSLKDPGGEKTSQQ